MAKPKNRDSSQRQTQPQPAVSTPDPVAVPGDTTGAMAPEKAAGDDGTRSDERKNRSAWQQEEFRALRAEILANQETQKNLLLFGTAVLGSVLGFIYRQDDVTPHRVEALILIQIMAAGFAYLFLRCALTTERIGTYIKNKFEQGGDRALSWETHIRQFPTGSGKLQDHKGLRQRGLELLTLSPFLGFCVLSALLISREKSLAQQSYGYIGWCIAIATVIGVVFFIYCGLDPASIETDTKDHILASDARNKRTHEPS